MSKIPKIFLSSCLIAALCVIFILASNASFTKSFKRDFFPNGIPSYLESSEVFHEKNVAWALLGASENDCEKWIAISDWGDGVSWQSSISDKSYKSKWFKHILNQYAIEDKDIERIHSKIVDGADVAYLIVLSRPIEGKYFCVVCVFRS